MGLRHCDIASAATTLELVCHSQSLPRTCSCLTYRISCQLLECHKPDLHQCIQLTVSHVHRDVIGLVYLSKCELVCACMCAC